MSYLPVTMRALAAALARLAAIVVAGWFVRAAIVSPYLPGPAAIVVIATAVAALWNPAEGLLLVAVLAPLGALIAASFDFQPFRLGEALVLAFAIGWLLRMARPPRVAPRIASWSWAAAWLFGLVVLASPIGLGWHAGRYSHDLQPIVTGIERLYFVAIDRLGLNEAAKLLEGLLLMAATVSIFRRRPALASELPIALTAAAVGAAGASVMLWWGLGPATLVDQTARIGYRVSAHVPDLNAAGSYFAMMASVAAGCALREHGSRRAGWAIAAAACLVGLRLSSSRAAIGALAAVAPIAIVWLATASRGTRVRVAAVGLTIVLLAVAAVAWTRAGRGPAFGLGYRTQFNATSLRMIAARPLFGVGLGRYYPDSSLFLTPELAWIYGSENAHDFFLQIAAEAGLLGLVLFGLCLAGPIAAAVRGLGRQPGDARTTGILAGIVVFLVTCLSGHPLLAGEVAFPFWMLLGLLGALGSSTVLNLDGARERASRFGPLAAVAAVVALLVVASVPVRALRAPLSPQASIGVAGLYGWEMEDGVRFRWTQQYASLFVPAGVTRVEMPLRAPRRGQSPSPIGVEVSVGGIVRGRFVVGDEWMVAKVDLDPAAVSADGYARVNLKTAVAWTPAFYVAGSSDMRLVGVQVGECVWRQN